MELNMNNNNAIRLRLQTACRSSASCLPTRSFRSWMRCFGASTDSEIVDAWGDFAAALYPHSVSLTDYLLTLVLEDENVYMLKRAQDLPVDPMLEAAVRSDLQTLQQLAAFSPDQLAGVPELELPRWKSDTRDFTEIYFARFGADSCLRLRRFCEIHHLYDPVGRPRPGPPPRRNHPRRAGRLSTGTADGY